jgi:hypothetical protein
LDPPTGYDQKLALVKTVGLKGISGEMESQGNLPQVSWGTNIDAELALSNRSCKIFKRNSPHCHFIFT